MRLPTLETCDQSNPEEKNLWVLVGLPGFSDSPFMVPEYLTRAWSKHLDDAGYRHHPELQKVKMRPPHRGQQHLLNGSAMWVDVDEPDPEPVEIPDPAQFTEHEQQVMLEQFRYMGKIPTAQEQADMAEIESAPRFDPTKHTATFVDGYLYGKPEKEIARVIALEMTSKKPRQSLLKKYRGR